MRYSQKYAKEHQISIGDDRNAALRATARPGRKRASLKKGLRDFWEKRKESMPSRKESKKHRPTGDLFLADIPNPLSEDQRRSIIERYLTDAHLCVHCGQCFPVCNRM